ncbi:hypothetical protein ACHAWF_007554 [Thalassiosira exigua]
MTMTMNGLALAIAVLLVSFPSTVAFSSTARVDIGVTRFTTKLNFRPETYERALDCANNYGICGIDELLDLSEELDEYLGCYVEDGPEACEKEIDVRIEILKTFLFYLTRGAYSGQHYVT